MDSLVITAGGKRKRKKKGIIQPEQRGLSLRWVGDSIFNERTFFAPANHANSIPEAAFVKRHQRIYQYPYLTKLKVI